VDNIKILVVDDDTSVRYTLQEICRLGGWQVVEAANGQDGLARLKEEKLDLVILDYHMPEMDGLEAVQQIRTWDSQVPILVLTVDERQSIADAFLAAGASDFALKPIKAPDLIARIRVHLNITKNNRQKNHEAYVVKGISSATLRLIQEFLENSPHPVTIEEITSGVNLAYQTVHRYLNYLVEEGRVVVECDYGRVGRPKNRYRLA